MIITNKNSRWYKEDNYNKIIIINKTITSNIILSNRKNNKNNNRLMIETNLMNN